LVGNLFQWHSAGDWGATGKRLIAEGRLPAPGDDELRTIEKLSSIEVCPGKIGAVQYRFEEIRTLQVGA
jgi:hypothetical protein